MDRKKTILIAVLVNAGLLTVLFVAALSSQDEVAPIEIAEKTITEGNAFEIAAKVELPIPVAEVPVVVGTPIVHKLPPAVPVAVAEPEKKAPLNEVVVKKGDSLDKIAKANHTTVDEIIRLNQLPGSFLKIGQVLKIPDGKMALQTPKQKPALEKIASNGPEYYTIMVGDNPWGIAMKNHMKLDELLKINHLNEEKARKLKPGDRLRIR